MTDDVPAPQPVSSSRPPTPTAPTPTAPTTATPGGLVARAVALLAGRERVLLGITGAPGAGKTTLARAVVEGVNAGSAAGSGPLAVHVPMDGFHLADVQLARLGLADRKGAPETFDGHGYVALLRRLRAAQEPTTYAPAFERDLEQALAGAVAVPRSVRLVVTEGNYLLVPGSPWGQLRELLDEVWFCEVDEGTRTERLLARHVEFGKQEQAARTWMARVDVPDGELAQSTRGDADLLVPGGWAADDPL